MIAGRRVKRPGTGWARTATAATFLTLSVLLAVGALLVPALWAGAGVELSSGGLEQVSHGQELSFRAAAWRRFRTAEDVAAEARTEAADAVGLVSAPAKRAALHKKKASARAAASSGAQAARTSQKQMLSLATALHPETAEAAFSAEHVARPNTRPRPSIFDKRVRPLGTRALHAQQLSQVLPPGARSRAPPSRAVYYLPAKKVPATENFENVRYYKVPSGEVAYYGDERSGPWFAEHRRLPVREEGEEGRGPEVNRFDSDCTSGCDLKQSRMLEAAEGLVRVALQTHTDREAALEHKDARNAAWARRISGLLQKMAPTQPNGVCHKTVDCDECAGIFDEGLCKQKLGLWIPKISVMQDATRRAQDQEKKLNKRLDAQTVAEDSILP